MEAQKNKQIITTILVLASVVLVVGGIVLFNKKSTKNTLSAANAMTTASTPTTQNATTSTGSDTGSSSNSATTPTASTSSSSSYKDGTYSTSADYYTPEDTDTIKVTLAVKNGVVSDVTATTTTSSRESRQYDSAFLDAYKSYVVGKSLSGLNLNRVSGASLTTEGFNSALDTIRQQAQA